MKTKETSTREQALAWWHNLNHEKQFDLQHVYKSSSRRPLDTIDLTGREIEEIWRKKISTKEIEEKRNQKQFKQFDESLFRAYISKFSDEDKLKAFEILFEKSKKWDGINNAAPFYISICRAYNAGQQHAIKRTKENIDFISSNNYFKREFGFK